MSDYKLGERTKELIAQEVAKELERQSGDEVFIYRTNDRTDFEYAFHGVDFLLVLWRLDEWLRQEIKYNPEPSEDEKVGYEKTRDRMRELLESDGLSLDMLR